MSRNNEKNIKKHNNKLHKEQDRVKNAEILLARKKLKQITKNSDSKIQKLTN
jgi:hypothetical protein